MSRRAAGAVSVQWLEAALCTLADLTTEDHPELDGGTRDEVSHVIYVLDQMIERRRAER